MNDSTSGSPASSPAARLLLIGGLLAGTLAAAVGLVRADRPGALPPEVVATVNGRPIQRDAWLRAVATVASERRSALSEADRQHILSRLVDEELLVQHGLALRLVERVPRLRSELISETMLAATLAAATDPDEAELRRFYAGHREFFTAAPRLRVAAWRLDAGGARLPYQPPVPDVLLPLGKLATYLGPELTAAAMRQPPGAAAAVESAGGRVLLQVLERQDAVAPDFETVREPVKAEYLRRAEETAVRALLDALRADGKVVVQPALP